MRTWHVLAPEYPPGCGGVGDYTALVAAGLAAAGDRVHVWHPGPGEAAGAGLEVHALPDRFGARTRAVLDRALSSDPGVLLVEYVPSAFGLRGLNLPFCRWIARLRQQGEDVRVMFHEPFFYFGLDRPWRNVLALVQRAMAAVLLRSATRIYYSTGTWTRLMARYGPQSNVELLPVPATIPVDVPVAAVAGARATRRAPVVIGHFGTYGEHVAGELRRVLPEILHRIPDARLLLLGRGSSTFANQMPPELRARIDSPAHADGHAIAAALRASDVLVQPFPDGVTTRRTSMMAALSSGVPTVTTDGALTEPIWRDSAAVRLAPAGDAAGLADAVAALAADGAARADLGARGRRLYDEQFALAVTLSRLRR